MAGLLILLLVGHTVFTAYTGDVESAFLLSLPSYEKTEKKEVIEQELVNKPSSAQEELPEVPVIKYVQEDNSVEKEDEVVEINEVNSAITELYGIDDLVYQPETDAKSAETTEKISITSDMLAMISESSPDYIKKNFYTLDKKTDILPEQLNVNEFLSYNAKIDNSIAGPKILIYHTHVYEAYADSNPNNYKDGVIAVGDELAKILTETYGYETMHHTDRYDMVNGKVNIAGAYERVSPCIEKILAENPSIQVVIDLHRDGTNGTNKFVMEYEGKPISKIMFVNGISQKIANGNIEQIGYLRNPNREANLAFSFQMQLLANEKFPDFSRKVYLNAYRYNQHMMPNYILLEVGNQNNTKQEALNAMTLFASVLDGVIAN